MALSPIPIDGRTLVPDITGGIQRGQQTNVLEAQQAAIQGQERRAQIEQQQLQQQQQAARGLAAAAGRGEPIETGQQLAQLFVDNPDLAQNVLDSSGVRTEFQKNDLADFGFQLEQASGNPQQQQQLIQQRVTKLQGQGRDPRDSAALLQADPARRAQFARTVQLAALNNAERLEIAKGPGLTAKQRERAALTEGLTPEQKDESALIALGLSPRAVGSAAITISQAGIAEQIGQSQAIIKEREKFGALTGASRAKAIDSGFERIGKIGTNINNLDRAIAAVEAGAGTGAIERRFPSIRAASVELDQIQGELALDVIGAVTFGALSEGELDLAKQIALPAGLEGPQLIQHLRDRKSAQEKLRNYFQEQINFLDQGGSVAGFLRVKERSFTEDGAGGAQLPPSGRQGGTLMTDASGNKAFVFPDGTFEEV